jgi:tetratricopeptide (TPR) repeat protein
MFGLFGKKKKTTLYDEIRDFVAYQKVSKLIEKANNLLKLGRREEAVNIFTDAEQVSINSVNNSPDSFQANLLLAFFYKEARVYDRAEEIFDNILSSDAFNLDEEKRIIVGAELQKLRREKPISEKNKRNSSDDFTKIYSCQNCGRIINYVTMPCPHCQWHPSDVSRADA